MLVFNLLQSQSLLRIATDVSQEFSAAYAGQQSIAEALAKAQALTNDAMEAAGYR